MRWLSRLITLIVIGAVVTAAVMLLRSKVPSATVGQGFRTYAMFRDASRLAVGSPVVIAGVRVGDITRLGIEGDVARVDMLLRDNVEIPADAFATRRADSLFGDSYIVIIPGDAPLGSVPNLRDGEQIAHVEEGGSTDNTLRTISRAMPRIDNAMERIHDFTVSGRKYAQGPLRARIEDADEWLAQGGISDPLASADKGMQRFDDGAARAAGAVHDAIPDVDKRLRGLADATGKATKRIREVRGSISEGFADARKGMDRVDPVVDGMYDVVSAIDEGRGDGAAGGFGRIVNDPKLADTLEDGTETLRDASSGLNYFKSFLGMRVEGNAFAQGVHVYATGELRAKGGDKFFVVELSKQDTGSIPHDALADNTGLRNFTRRQLITDTLRFTLQFGKQFGRVQLRGGIKESTFGVGGDFLIPEYHLKLSADVYGAYAYTPRVKVGFEWGLNENIFFVGGIDDALVSPGYLHIVPGNTQVPNFFDEIRFGRDYFVGAALHFDDQDLGILLRVYGGFVLGLLVL